MASTSHVQGPSQDRLPPSEHADCTVFSEWAVLTFYAFCGLHCLATPFLDLSTFWIMVFRSAPLICLLLHIALANHDRLKDIPFGSAATDDVLIAVIFSIFGVASMEIDSSIGPYLGMLFFTLSHVFYVATLKFSPVKPLLAVLPLFIVGSACYEANPDTLFTFCVLIIYGFFLFLLGWRALAQIDFLGFPYLDKDSTMVAIGGFTIVLSNSAMITLHHELMLEPATKAGVVLLYHLGQSCMIRLAWMV